MMITWRLWQALRTPPINNPLFRQMQIQKTVSWLDRFWNLFGTGLLILFFVHPTIFVLIVLAIPLLYPLVSSTLYGILWALRTTSVVYRRRQQGSYDLIRIAPGGAWQAFWGVCAGSVHRNGDLDRLYMYLSRILTMLFGIGIIVTLASIVLPEERIRIEAFNVAVVVYTLIALALIEYTQTSIISTLIGVSSAIHAKSTVDARAGALFGFLMLQFLSYLSTCVFVVSFLIPLMLRLTLNYGLETLFICSAMLLYVISIRELTAYSLWRLISRRLNTDSAEMARLLVSEDVGMVH